MTEFATLARRELSEVRRDLHRIAERPGEEARTSQLIADHLEAARPDRIVTRLGGHGVAAVFDGRRSGPTVLLRCDMDALPMPEGIDVPYASPDPGAAHKCGHDGHMTIQLGVARALSQQRPARGRVVVLFQPAEETGEGAERVIEDERFADLRPDRAIALHNLPGRPLGQVVVRSGAFASASQGMIVDLRGVTSHAAEPHMGRSPVAAAANIAQGIQAAPQRAVSLDTCVQATVVGIDVGGPAFGTSPGNGRVMATLRAHTSEGMAQLTSYCERLAAGIAHAYELECDISWTDRFPATENTPAVARLISDAARSMGLEVVDPGVPFSWSEDFGHFTSRFPGALFGLGSGADTAPLHHPDFDFPDALIETGRDLFLACLPGLLRDEL